MSCASKLNLTIIQGATFSKAIHWYGGGKVCKLIEDLVPGCPTKITITGHGLPSVSDTPIFLSHVKGATRANTDETTPAIATYIDDDNFYVDVDTVAQTYTANTGLLTYFSPKDITSYTARMDIRESIDDDDAVLSLTSPTELSLRTADARILITIADTVTSTLAFEEGVYDLELEDSSGVVTRLVEGTVTLCKEVTR